MIERRPIPDRETWLGWRREFLTASDVPAAAGLSPWKSALSLYMEKTTSLPPQAESGAMKRGRLFEAAALAYLQEEHPDWTIERPNVFIADTADRLGCTPDAIVNGSTNCQIKTISRSTYEQWAGNVPVYYQLQTVCEGMLLDAERSILCVLVVSAFDASIETFAIPRHFAAEEKIRQISRAFWANVNAGRRPLPDFRIDSDIIKSMFPHSTGEVLDLSGDNHLAEILPKRETLQDQQKTIKAELEALDAEIRFKLGEAEQAELPGWRISLKEQHRKAYQVAESTSRVLRIKHLEEQQ